MKARNSFVGTVGADSPKPPRTVAPEVNRLASSVIRMNGSCRHHFAMHYGTSIAWLMVGAVLLAASNRSSEIPIAIWLALTFVLHASRAMPVFPGLVYVAVASYVALAIGSLGTVPLPGP